MDKLKKQIFIGLTVLLTAAAVALALLLNGVKSAKTPPQQPAADAVETPLPENKLRRTPADTDGKQPPQESAENGGKQQDPTAQQPPESAPETDLARFLDAKTLQTVEQKLQQGNWAEAHAVGMAYIINKHNIQAMRETKEYNQILTLRRNLSPQKQSPRTEPAPEAQPADPLEKQTVPAGNSAQPRKENSSSTSGILPRWEETPCTPELLPHANANGLSCRRGEAGFCAFFDNGRPYFCRTEDGLTEYILNKWSSSLTVLRKTPKGEPLFEHDYANGKLTRAKKYEGKNLVTTIWFNGGSLRLTQTNAAGKVLNKYYFYPGRSYIHYPDGNDMGEQNGEWEQKDGRIFMDGKPFFTLPAAHTAPDVCALFPGACAQPQTQAGQELL